MQSLSVRHINLIGLSCANLLPHFLIIARENELEELVIRKRTTSIEIVELHQ